jgi:hypothetical protein
MVGQNLILVSEIILFIPNPAEEERKNNQKRKNIFGNKLSSSTKNCSSENSSVVADSQTVHPSSLLSYRYLQ